MADKTLQNYYNNTIVVDSDIRKNFAFNLGDLKLLTNYDSIVQSIRNILNTKKGEMPGLVEFGSSLNSFLFEQLSETNVEALKSTLISEIQRFENRVNIVDFKYDLNNPIGTLKLDMVFTIKALGPNQFFREGFPAFQFCRQVDFIRGK